MCMYSHAFADLCVAAISKYTHSILLRSFGKCFLRNWARQWNWINVYWGRKRKKEGKERRREIDACADWWDGLVGSLGWSVLGHHLITWEHKRRCRRRPRRCRSINACCELLHSRSLPNSQSELTVVIAKHAHDCFVGEMRAREKERNRGRRLPNGT